MFESGKKNIEEWDKKIKEIIVMDTHQVLDKYRENEKVFSFIDKASEFVEKNEKELLQNGYDTFIIKVRLFSEYFSNLTDLNYYGHENINPLDPLSSGQPIQAMGEARKNMERIAEEILKLYI
jgi:hypothetical protein